MFQALFEIFASPYLRRYIFDLFGFDKITAKQWFDGRLTFRCHGCSKATVRMFAGTVVLIQRKREVLATFRSKSCKTL